MLDPENDFLPAICASPPDDVVRLVCADCLEESGHPAQVARAEFIRVQCELARLQEGDAQLPVLRAREADLLRTHQRHWNGSAHRRLQAGPLHGQKGTRRHLVRGWEYRRGFIAFVTTQASAFAEHPDQFLLLGPLERLRVRAAAGLLSELLWAMAPTRIKELDLSANQLYDRHVRQLLAYPGMNRLEQLDLRHNAFSAVAYSELATAARAGQLPRETLLGFSQVPQPLGRPAQFPRAAARPAEVSLAGWLRSLWSGG